MKLSIALVLTLEESYKDVIGLHKRQLSDIFLYLLNASISFFRFRELIKSNNFVSIVKRVLLTLGISLNNFDNFSEFSILLFF